MELESLQEDLRKKKQNEASKGRKQGVNLYEFIQWFNPMLSYMEGWSEARSP
jgi:hypothetical protein